LFAPLKEKKNSPYLSYNGNKFFSSPKPPDQLWGIPNLPGVKTWCTKHLLAVPRLRMSGIIPPISNMPS
jgi:hypothetical protein